MASVWGSGDGRVGVGGLLQPLRLPFLKFYFILLKIKEILHMNP